jgi:hypothetical protein
MIINFIKKKIIFFYESFNKKIENNKFLFFLKSKHIVE